MFPEHPMDGPCFRDKPANFGIVRVNGNDIGGGDGRVGKHATARLLAGNRRAS